jgi:hypothetical protein
MDMSLTWHHRQVERAALVAGAVPNHLNLLSLSIRCSHDCKQHIAASA